MATLVLHGEGFAGDTFPVYITESYTPFFVVDATTNGNGFTDAGHVDLTSGTEPQLTFHLTGSFAQASPGAPITGTVTGMSVTNPDDFDVFDITGINNVSLTDLAAAGNNLDQVINNTGFGSIAVVHASFALYNLILGGNDVIHASNNGDDVFGLGGHDILIGGSQSDNFWFAAPYMKAGDSDKITNFAPSSSSHADYLEIDHTAVGIHHLNHPHAGEFKVAINPGAAHIWEDPRNGDVYYKGPHGKIEIVQLLNHNHVVHVDANHIDLF
jgi:hypothetical protein